MEGWIMSSALLGSVVGAIISGYLSDRFGRRSILMLSARLIGLEQYNEDRYDTNNILEKRDQIKADFEKVFKLKSTEEWLDVLLPADIWCAQVNSFKEMVEDQQVRHNEMILEYEHPTVGKVKTTGFPTTFSDAKQEIRKPAPVRGEHTEEILRAYSHLSEDEIRTFNH